MSTATSESLEYLSVAAAISRGGILSRDFIGRSWDRWRAVLKAANGEQLDKRELRLFREVAERDPPRRRVRELWIIAGRRAGKDSIAAAIAVMAACQDYSSCLRTGEMATVLCLASDRAQAGILHRYIAGHFTTDPVLRQLVLREAGDVLELKNSLAAAQLETGATARSWSDGVATLLVGAKNDSRRAG
jgi:hypothetical protein